MTKEQIYRQQMIELGIWEDVFAPEVSTLAQMERDLTRAKKAWSETAPPGGKPSVLDPHFAIITGLRREILAHREALGLTPKGLRKLRGPVADGPSEQDLITERLNAIAERVGSYDPGAGLPGAELPQLEAGDGEEAASRARSEIGEAAEAESRARREIGEAAGEDPEEGDE